MGSPFLALSAIGALVVSRRQRDVFGWALLVSPILLGIGVFSDDYVGRVREGAVGPAAAWIGLVGHVSYVAALGGMALALYRFPDGKPVSRWWRLPESLTALGVLLGIVRAVLYPWADERLALANPLFGDRGAEVVRLLEPFGQVMLVGGLLSIASLFDRYRRSGPQIRVQLRWLIYPVVLGLTAAGGLALLEAAGAVRLGDAAGIATTMIFTLGVPAGVVAAITRARLYEIDRIIRRTVSYGVISVVLAGVYMLIAVVPGAFLDLQSDLLVAAATLVAVAALRPLRRRVQSAVDQRFDRARYDARRIVDQFTERLRDEVDLDELRSDLFEQCRRSRATGKRTTLATTEQRTGPSVAGGRCAGGEPWTLDMRKGPALLAHRARSRVADAPRSRGW